MPIRPRVPGSGLTPRRAAVNAAAGPGGHGSAGARLTLCVCLCLLVTSGALVAQTPPPRVAAPAGPPIDTAVREALQQYSAALESLDAEQVKKIHPSVDGEALKRAFREMRELKVTIDSIKVLSTDGATVRVSCRVTQALTPRAGTKQNNTVTRVLRLRKQETAWLIDGFER